jgi:hypothetical protein
MAKMNPIKVFARGPGSLSFSCSFPTDVLSDGIFQTLVPDEHAEAIKAFLKKPDFEKVSWDVNRASKPVLKASQLASIQVLLDRFAETQVESVKETELVIFYRLASNTNYYVKDGEVYPNGVGLDGGQWVNPGGGSNNNSLEYTVGVTARVVAKVTARFSGGFYVTHERPDIDDESFGGRLNAFTHVKYPGREFWSVKIEGQRAEPLYDTGPIKMHNNTGWQVMPYTEENAKFFYEMMLNVCRLSERISQYLGDDPQKLMDNIASTKALPYFSR